MLNGKKFCEFVCCLFLSSETDLILISDISLIFCICSDNNKLKDNLSSVSMSLKEGTLFMNLNNSLAVPIGLVKSCFIFF